MKISKKFWGIKVVLKGCKEAFEYFCYSQEEFKERMTRFKSYGTMDIKDVREYVEYRLEDGEKPEDVKRKKGCTYKVIQIAGNHTFF